MEGLTDATPFSGTPPTCGQLPVTPWSSRSQGQSLQALRTCCLVRQPRITRWATSSASVWPGWCSFSWGSCWLKPGMAAGDAQGELPHLLTEEKVELGGIERVDPKDSRSPAHSQTEEGPCLPCHLTLARGDNGHPFPRPKLTMANFPPDLPLFPITNTITLHIHSHSSP